MSVLDAILGLRKAEHRAAIAGLRDTDDDEAYTAALIAANRPKRSEPHPLPKVEPAQ